MQRSSLLLPLFTLALVTACAPDRRADDPNAAASANSAAAEAYVPPVLTPAESAAAVAKIQAEGEAKTREIMGPEYKPPTDTFVDTPQKQFDSCMAQANSVDEPVKSTILRACERFRIQAQQQKQQP